MSKTTYKNTPIGLIPSDWEVKKLGSLGKTFTGLSGKNKDDFGEGFQYIPYKNIFQNSIIDIYFMDLVKIKPNETQSKVKYGDLFFTTSSETAEEVGMCSVLLEEVENMYLNSFCFGFRFDDFEILDPKFSSYLFRGEQIRQEITVLAQGSTRFNLSKSELQKLKIPLPPLQEQQKIAEILTAWDIAINTSKSTLEELIKQKKWLAYNLLFNRNTDNQKEINNLVPLSKLLIRVKNRFTPDPKKYYKQIGIRSHTKGIFYKEEVSGLSLGNKSVFHIEPNCFILNIVFAWEHAIAKTTLNEVGMIASHRFPMFKPVPEKLDLDYLLHFFKSQKGKDLLGLASPGGAGRNKTLGQSDFLKLKIPVPNIKEQKIIAEVLDKADEEILLFKEKIANLQLQKKGLMQQLLTGKVRVKI
ncbi:MAG: restriction endonuclease subunit S [Sphingobacteriaceae bacterium]|nr:restriction endonuclease subunit S [Sphingobacteriaceae bacterium]